MLYIGIDPGKKGALALLDENAPPLLLPFGEDAYIAALRRASEGEAVACLEHVGAMPGQGVTSMFTFGQNFGYIRGLLEAFRIPYELVRPQKWKKVYSITGDKNSAIAVCRRLFPAVPLHRTERCRTDDDGMAEALLMAEYARRHLCGLPGVAGVPGAGEAVAQAPTKLHRLLRG